METFEKNFEHSFKSLKRHNLKTIYRLKLNSDEKYKKRLFQKFQNLTKIINKDLQ